jgi:thioester reductase-like protein
MPRHGYQEVALITGFPSLVASRVLRTILSSEPSTLLYAIVRPSAFVQAEQVLGSLDRPHRERVILLEGDAASMDLGLSGPEYRSLASEVDRIHHVPLATSAALGRRDAERVYVEAAAEILDLGGACKTLKCLVLHSSVEVAGDRTGLVREEDLEAGQSFSTVVAETRARAEKLARQAMTRMPIAVARAATIVGDSRTGEIDHFDGPYLFIVLIVTAPPDLAVPLLVRGDAPLHLVPVDHVVRVCYAIGRDDRAPGHTFHIVDPDPLPARRVFELVAEACGRPLPHATFPANLARALLRAPGLERLAGRPRAFVDQLVTDVRFDATNTRTLLSGKGIVCPAFESYVEPLVRYVQAQFRDRPAATSR